MLAALKQTLRNAWSLEYISAEEYQRAIDLKSVKGEKPDAAAGRALSYEEWIGLFAACQSDPGPAGARDAAIIALLKIAGLRCAEVASLQLADYNRRGEVAKRQAVKKLYVPYKRRFWP